MSVRYSSVSVIVATAASGLQDVNLGRTGNLVAFNAALGGGSTGPAWAAVSPLEQVSGIGVEAQSGWLRTDAVAADRLHWQGTYPLKDTLGVPVVRFFVRNDSGASVTGVFNWAVEE